jgi:hypothetical protein
MPASETYFAEDVEAWRHHAPRERGEVHRGVVLLDEGATLNHVTHLERVAVVHW